jgi:DNA-binding PadR family transcriptional regulator
VTELEACVLAVICRQGPITAYQVRREFERSPASSWRASTGSIYPLIKRLRARGFVQADQALNDGRGTLRLAASDAGRAQVRDWLTVLPPWMGDITEDPIRTRFQFFTLLDASARARAAAEMFAATAEAIEKLTAFNDTLESHSLERIAHDGAMAMLRARLAWLASVEAQFTAEDAPADPK